MDTKCKKVAIDCIETTVSMLNEYLKMIFGDKNKLCFYYYGFDQTIKK